MVSLPNIRHLSALRAIFLGRHFLQRDCGMFDRKHTPWFTIADGHGLLTGYGLKVSARDLALRWGDRGGGRINRLLNYLLKAAQQWTPVREFLTYQMCLRAEAAP